MEQMDAISGFEWNSMNGICSDEAEFMAQLLGNCLIPNEVPSNSSFPKFWPDHASNDHERFMYHSLDETVFSDYFLDVSRHHFLNGDCFMSMDMCKENGDVVNQDVSSNDSMESNENMSEAVVCGNNLQIEDHLLFPNMPDISRVDTIGSLSGSKKRSRPSAEVKNKRSMKLKKCVNYDDNDFVKDNHNNMKIHMPSSSSCCSEDDSNTSHEAMPVSVLDGSKGSGALNSNGKTRAGRGSATDPQSLYARKRRERINERLKILQKLVPNGTKVDISTMLEEAVQYVKFLQLQIKLLSSDDMWMYAPIAYNGMDIGLDFKISTPKPQC